MRARAEPGATSEPGDPMRVRAEPGATSEPGAATEPGDPMRVRAEPGATSEPGAATEPGDPMRVCAEPGATSEPGDPMRAPTLGLIMRAFKSISALYVNRQLARSGSLWQRNYYERIIRDEAELQRIREYIETNPALWSDDSENPNGRS
jgi:hypothetical protein